MLEISLAILGLILSFLYSGAEIALLTANRLQIEVWARKAVRGAFLAMQAQQQPENFLTTTLVGVNIANILTTSFATVLLLRIIPSEWLVLLIVAITVLILGEIIPKTLFREFPNASMLFFGRFIRISQYVFSPIMGVLWLYRRYILRNPEMADDQSIDHNELHLLFNDPRQESGVDVHERQTIARIFQLRNRQVGEVMTPRPDITAVDINMSMDEAETVFLESGFSKLPVYEDTVDKIKGVLFLYDLFSGASSVSESIREAYFVPESKSAVELLAEFKAGRMSIAIVIDEYGGTAGLVTMEDLSEEVFGEFNDAFDEEEAPVQTLEQGLLVRGNAEISWLNNEYNLGIPPGDYETLAGYLTDVLGHIPQKNEYHQAESFRYVISSASATRIETVFVQAL